AELGNAEAIRVGDYEADRDVVQIPRSGELRFQLEVLVLFKVGQLLTGPVLDPDRIEMGAVFLPRVAFGSRPVAATEVQSQVASPDFGGIAEQHDSSVGYQHGAIALLLDRSHLVGDKDNRLACLPHLAERVVALLLKGSIADS